MKAKILFCYVMVAMGSGLYAQLPDFEGTDLNNKKVRIPKDMVGKKSLLGFTFSQHSQDELEGWLEPVYYEFIDTNTLAAMVYDVNVFLVVSLNEANSKFRDRIFKQLRENVLKEFYPHVIITEFGPKQLMDALGISDENNIHIFTFDPLGDQTYQTKGSYSDDKFEKLASYLEIE